MNKILKAIQYGDYRHGGQVRKINGRPYFTDHCLKLMGHIACDRFYSGDETAAIIMLLHDVVEDCSKSDSDYDRGKLYYEIEVLFGMDVYYGVKELTNVFTKARYPTQNRKWRTQHELERLSGISDRGKVLKLYDRDLNLRDMIADNDWNLVYADESLALALCLYFHNAYYISARVTALAGVIKAKCLK